MTSIEQKVEQVVKEVKKLKREVKKLKKTFILDITKVEVWTEIDVAPEYMISSFGRVRRKRDEFEPKIGVHKLTGYPHVYLNGKQYKIHRLLAEKFIPNPENKPFIDHVDGDRQNNSLENLRWATRDENNRNARRRTDNTTDFKGVSFDTARGKYQAACKGRFLGRFHTPEEASAVYEAAAKEAFGKFYRPPE